MALHEFNVMALKLIDVVVIFTHASCMMKIMKVEIGPIAYAHYIFHKQKKGKKKNKISG